MITAAAAIMACVFESSVIGGPLCILDVSAQFGRCRLGRSTLVRMALVPSVMQPLGKSNWWFPDRLDRPVPHLNIDSRPAPSAPLRPADTTVCPAGRPRGLNGRTRTIWCTLWLWHGEKC